jgi:tRNA threonylcarbamoyl adenosine modification protein YeaZ
MKVLALETSTPSGSVAVFSSGELIFEERFTSDRSHSSTLFIALEKARAKADRFDRIAVGLGPGSYAGARISIAAALGMNLVLAAELVGIPSVAALDTPESSYLVVGDARRGMLYFTAVDAGQCVAGPLLATAEEVRREIAGRLLPVMGTEPMAAFPSLVVALPSAAIIAQLAARDCGIVQRGDLEPLYLREPHITQPRQAPSLPPGSAFAGTKQ